MKTLKRLERFYRNNEAIINILLLAIMLRIALLDIPTTYSFDEGFYTPAARYLLQGQPDPVWEHPLMGKYMIGAGLTLFGDNAVGRRMPSLLIGSLGIFVFYFMLRRLKVSEKVSLMASLLLAADFLHIMLSRTAILDIYYFTFFVVGMYFLLGKNKWDFAYAGLFFGLAVASKWTALFGLGAALSYLLLTKQFRAKHALTFLAIPLIVYLATYAPYIATNGIASWADLQWRMYDKLAMMKDTTPQISQPWQWPFGQKAIWLTRINEPATGPLWFTWLGTATGGVPYGGTVAFGNPLFYWPALFAMLYTAYRYCRKRDRVDLFILTWAAFFYLPWFFTARANLYFYYFLPVVPMYALALSRFFHAEAGGLAKKYVIIVLLSVLFFYPLLSGIPINEAYFNLLSPLIGSYPEGTAFLTIGS